MGPRTPELVDEHFVEVAKYLLGDAADPRELYEIAKSMPDTSDVSTPGGGQQNKKKAIAGGLLLGTAAEGSATAAAAKHAFPSIGAHAEQIARPVTQVLKPILTRVPRLPAGAGGKAHFALQATNLGVGLAAAHELLKKPKQKVAKRLVPVAEDDQMDLTFTGEIAKFDSDKRQVFGWCSLSEVDGQPVVDLQGDFVPIEEIEKSAYRYVLESRKGGDMHKRVNKGFDVSDQPLHTADLVESFVVTPEKLEKMGLPPDSLPLGWWVGFKVHDDEQWQLVKKGERAGFSIHGTGQRRPYEELAKAEWTKKVRRDVGARVRSAAHPPPVKLSPVTSSAMSSAGYQKQTRRLAVEMKSRPGDPYQYRVAPKNAKAFMDAPSKGRAYTQNIRGQAKRATGYTPGDRARLFLHPVKGAS